jgi:hypothetical protein
MEPVDPDIFRATLRNGRISRRRGDLSRSPLWSFETTRQSPGHDAIVTIVTIVLMGLRDIVFISEPCLRVPLPLGAAAMHSE